MMYNVMDRSGKNVASFSCYKDATNFIATLDGIDFTTQRVYHRGVIHKYGNEPIVNKSSRKMIIDVIEDLFGHYEEIKELAINYNDALFTKMYRLFDRAMRHADMDFELSKCIKYMKDVVMIIEESKNPWRDDYNQKIQHTADKADAIITMLILEYGGKY